MIRLIYPIIPILSFNVAHNGTSYPAPPEVVITAAVSFVSLKRQPMDVMQEPKHFTQLFKYKQRRCLRNSIYHSSCSRKKTKINTQLVGVILRHQQLDHQAAMYLLAWYQEEASRCWWLESGFGHRHRHSSWNPPLPLGDQSSLRGKGKG